MAQSSRLFSLLTLETLLVSGPYQVDERQSATRNSIDETIDDSADSPGLDGFQPILGLGSELNSFAPLRVADHGVDGEEHHVLFTPEERAVSMSTLWKDGVWSTHIGKGRFLLSSKPLSSGLGQSCFDLIARLASANRNSTAVPYNRYSPSQSAFESQHRCISPGRTQGTT